MVTVNNSKGAPWFMLQNLPASWVLFPRALCYCRSYFISLAQCNALRTDRRLNHGPRTPIIAKILGFTTTILVGYKIMVILIIVEF